MVVLWKWKSQVEIMGFMDPRVFRGKVGENWRVQIRKMGFE